MENINRGFPKFGNNYEYVHDLTKVKLWTWKKLSEISILKNKIWSILLQKKLNYLSFLSMENNNIKLVRYKEFADKNTGNKVL